LSNKMPYFVIDGTPDCPNFGHAIIVAQYLSEHLPDFKYKKVEVKHSVWAEHLMEMNEETKWSVVKSPIIWKEIHQWGGKKYLIGGLSEFWEYVYCYYGLESRIPKSELLKLAAENLKFFEKKEQDAAERINHVRVVGIIGASERIVTLLLNELFEIPNFRREGVIVKLYDERAYEERKRKTMEDVADYFNNHSVFGAQTVFIVDKLKGTIDHCDLLLIVEDFRPCAKWQPGQDENYALEKCFANMNYLAEGIAVSKPQNLRIIVAGQGPTCFLATCLVEFCATVRLSDIVVVAADEGLSYLSALAEKTEIPVHKISAPPVWGFIGMKSFVDLRHTVFKADVYRPNERSLTAPHGSTLPLGTIKSELRLMSHLIPDQNEIERIVDERKKKIMKTLEHPPLFSKIRAIISLLKLWYAEEPSDEIISLGVCSNGSFGIPPGVVFSQPVKLNAKGKWVPYSQFPLMDDRTVNEIANCVESTTQTLRQFGLSCLYQKHLCLDDDDFIYSFMKAEDGG
ncbi:hypothetical protein NQ315_008505, partial [Exocentrus adspersus]